MNPDIFLPPQPPLSFILFPPPSPSSVPPPPLYCPPPPLSFILSPPPSPNSVPPPLYCPPPPLSFIPFPPPSASSVPPPPLYCPPPPHFYPTISTGIHWNKPPPGFVKLNTDASYKCNCSSIAGVCRDDEGIWMFGFSSKVQSGSSFEAELVAVREALKLAWEIGLERVIVESDSESVVNRINNQIIRQPRNQLEAIILECQGYGSRAWSCFIHHTHREGNFAADALTKELVLESFELHVWNHPPESLSLILLADMIGMDVPRHGVLDQNQIGYLKCLKRELLARNLHWY